MRCMAVSKAFHLHLTSKLASANVLLSTVLAGLTLQKRENRIWVLGVGWWMVVLWELINSMWAIVY